MNGDLVMDTENWVKMWVDTGHGIVADNGTCVAFRGIDLQGQLMWLVRHHKRAHGYHSTQISPHAAIQEAEAAWSDRARVKARWHHVKRVARELIIGKKHFYVSRDDAHRSALCGAGIDAFMRQMGMSKRNGLSGRTAAILMIFEPQLGFAIYAAYERSLAERATTKAHLSQMTPQS